MDLIDFYAPPDEVYMALRRANPALFATKVERKEEMAINGNNLKAEMVRKGMGLADLGEELGIGRYAAERYCDDMTTMPASVLVEAAKLFGCSTDWLLGRSEERSVKSPTNKTPW